MTLQQLQNLVKARQLKLEPPDQAEFTNLITAAKRHLQDARVEGFRSRAGFHWRTARRMRWRWRRCVGMATGQTTATWCFNVCNTLWASHLRNGVSWTPVISSAISRNTKVSWTSLRSCWLS